jgi:hypothetical protein
VLLTYSKIRLGVLLCEISALQGVLDNRSNCKERSGLRERLRGRDPDLIVADDIVEGDDVGSTTEDLKDLDFSLDFLLFHRLQDLDDAFLIVRDGDSFEYLRVLSPSNLPHNLIVIRVPRISAFAKAAQNMQRTQLNRERGRERGDVSVPPCDL